MMDVNPPAQRIAALDLGSNSFHIVVAEVVDGELRLLAKHKQRVRLAAGLDGDHLLSEEAQQRGLVALRALREVLDTMPVQAALAIGTHTLRQASNASEFTQRGAQILGFPIEVVSGEDEARLIYKGVAFAQRGEDKRLVIDIGGGSTEIIAGVGATPNHLASRKMGAVTFEREFFTGGEISLERFDACQQRCYELLGGLCDGYRAHGWAQAWGSSGTALALAEVMRGKGHADAAITLPRLRQVRDEVIALGHADRIDFPALSPERRGLLAPGLAILLSCFEKLEISEMRACDAALREGALLELLQRGQRTGQ